MPDPQTRFPISNAGSDSDADMRRSGGSPNDPHGGHENIEEERKAPTPDPVDELVPGGDGGVPPTRVGEQAAETFAFTGTQQPNLPDSSAGEPAAARAVPGSGKLEEPVEGNENLFVIDPATKLPRLKS